MYMCMCVCMYVYIYIHIYNVDFGVELWLRMCMSSSTEAAHLAHTDTIACAYSGFGV